MFVADFANISVLGDNFEVVLVAFFERFECDFGDTGSHLTIIFKFKLPAKYFNTIFNILHSSTSTRIQHSVIFYNDWSQNRGKSTN